MTNWCATNFSNRSTLQFHQSWLPKKTSHSHNWGNLQMNLCPSPRIPFLASTLQVVLNILSRIPIPRDIPSSPVMSQEDCVPSMKTSVPHCVVPIFILGPTQKPAGHGVSGLIKTTLISCPTQDQPRLCLPTLQVLLPLPNNLRKTN